MTRQRFSTSGPPPGGWDTTLHVIAPAKKVSEQLIKDLKKFPIPFEVEYDPAVIEKGHTYAVQVRIETKERLDYINDTRVEVISSGKPSKDVQVPVIRVKK